MVAAKGGERATFKAQGVGKILDGAGVSYRGAQYFYSDSPKFSGLNRIAVVFEYEADAEGNTKSKLFRVKVGAPDGAARGPSPSRLSPFFCLE
jgi:hypothetical protein